MDMVGLTFYLPFITLMIFFHFSCKKDNQNAQGCQSVSPKPLQIELPTAVDPARDLQRLNSLIMDHLQPLEKLNVVGTSLVNGYEDLVQAGKTASDLRDVALNLNQINLRYKSAMLREMRYGSMQHPIGDDNYFHMNRNGMIAQQMQSVGPNFFSKNDRLRNSNDKFSQC